MIRLLGLIRSKNVTFEDGHSAGPHSCSGWQDVGGESKEFRKQRTYSSWIVPTLTAKHDTQKRQRIPYRMFNELTTMWLLLDTFCCLSQRVVLWLCPCVNGFIHMHCSFNFNDHSIFLWKDYTSVGTLSNLTHTDAEWCMVSKYTVSFVIYYSFTKTGLCYATLLPPLVNGQRVNN